MNCSIVCSPDLRKILSLPFQKLKIPRNTGSLHGRSSMMQMPPARSVSVVPGDGTGVSRSTTFQDSDLREILSLGFFFSEWYFIIKKFFLFKKKGVRFYKRDVDLFSKCFFRCPDTIGGILLRRLNTLIPYFSGKSLVSAAAVPGDAPARSVSVVPGDGTGLSGSTIFQDSDLREILSLPFPKVGISRKSWSPYKRYLSDALIRSVSVILGGATRPTTSPWTAP